MISRTGFLFVFTTSLLGWYILLSLTFLRERIQYFHAPPRGFPMYFSRVFHLYFIKLFCILVLYLFEIWKNHVINIWIIIKLQIIYFMVLYHHIVVAWFYQCWIPRSPWALWNILLNSLMWYNGLQSPPLNIWLLTILNEMKFRSRTIGQLHWMVLATNITALPLDIHRNSSTTETMRIIRTQICLGYSSLTLHKRFILVYQIGLRHKCLSDL